MNVFLYEILFSNKTNVLYYASQCEILFLQSIYTQDTDSVNPPKMILIKSILQLKPSKLHTWNMYMTEYKRY